MKNRLRLSTLTVIFVAATLQARYSYGEIIIEVSEAAGDVTLSYSGSLNGTFEITGLTTGPSQIRPADGMLWFSPTGSLPTSRRFTTTTSTTAFGSGAFATPTISTGDTLLIGFPIGRLAPTSIWVDPSFDPGVTTISGEMIFSSTTLGSLGIDLSNGPITIGTLVGSGDTVTMQAAAVPEPAAFGVLTIGGLGFVASWRRRIGR